MVEFKTEQDYKGYYEGLKIVDTDNATYGIVKLNGDSAVYLSINYNKGDEDDLKITFDIGDYENNDMYHLTLVDRNYDPTEKEFIDKPTDFALELNHSIKTIYFIPVPITNKNLRINIDTDGDDIDLKIIVKSQSYRV